MKVKLTLLIIVATISLSAGQDHLSALDKIDTLGFFRQYHDSLEAKLIAGLGTKPLVRYLVAPSFSPEYVLVLIKENKDYFLVFQTLDKNFWHSKDSSNHPEPNRLDHCVGHCAIIPGGTTQKGERRTDGPRWCQLFLFMPEHQRQI
jgi:hypothetical protein